jgi:hypothetical protein
MTVIKITDIGHIARVVFSPDAENGSFVMLIKVPVFDSYLDESSDKHQEFVVCVASFLARERHWRHIQELWMDRLAKDSVKYFSAKECQAVQGPFRHLRHIHGSLQAAKAVGAKIRSDLETISLSKPQWTGFCVGIIVPDYREVLLDYPIATRFFAGDPLEHAYAQVMYESMHTVRRKAKGNEVAFVIDNSNYSNHVLNAFNSMRENHPVIAKAAKTVLPLDDKETAPLQIADLLASIVKDGFLAWMKDRGKGRYPLPEQWDTRFERVGTWDKEHMLRSLTRTLNSARFANDTLARRPQKEKKMTRGDIKRMRRAMVAELKGLRLNHED